MGNLSQTIPLASPDPALESTDVREPHRARLAGVAFNAGGIFGFVYLLCSARNSACRDCSGQEMRGAFAATIYFHSLVVSRILGASEIDGWLRSTGLPDVELRRSAARYGLFAGHVVAGLCFFSTGC